MILNYIIGLTSTLLQEIKIAKHHDFILCFQFD
jgi:hypothetical protein